MLEIKNCPICNSEKLNKKIELKDYFLSEDNFTILECIDCGFMITNPQPEGDKIGDYYKSEEYISHSNTKKGLVNAVYQIVRNFTLKRKFQMVKKLKKRGSILDIGCATGEFLNVFKLDKWEAMGIEPDEEARKFAIHNYNLKVADQGFLNKIEEKSYDIISMWHVLEHVHDLNERIQIIHKILKDDGKVIIAVPNYKSYDAENYGKFWAAYDVPRHLFHFNKLTMEKLLVNNNMKLTEVKPMKFDSFYVSMLSEKYKYGKPNLLRAFFTGFKSNLNAMNTGEYSSLIYIAEKA